MFNPIEIFSGKTVLITGGTGFLGRALATEILKYYPKAVRIFSRDEFKHHRMQEDFSSTNMNGKLRFLIGDVRDYGRLKRAIKGCDIVIHAAALKRIEMIEYNVDEAIKTNILGTMNVVKACLENNVEKAILVSTDKACAPVNTYGACKFVGERIFTESNYSKGDAKTVFICVRYGNVLGSTGSVIPFFTEKIKKGEVIPLTDERMTRFVITEKQAVELIFKAVRYGVGGEVFVPRLPSFKIIDLIEVLKEKLNVNNEIKIIGLRPGEKIHESMINYAEVPRTFEFEDVFIINSCIVNPWVESKDCEYLNSAKKTSVVDEFSSKDVVVSKEEVKVIIDEFL